MSDERFEEIKRDEATGLWDATMVPWLIAEVARLRLADSILRKLAETTAFDFFEDSTMAAGSISGEEITWIELDAAELEYLTALTKGEEADG